MYQPALKYNFGPRHPFPPKNRFTKVYELMKSATIIFTIISTRYVKTYYKLIKLTLKIITKEKSKVTHKFK